MKWMQMAHRVNHRVGTHLHAHLILSAHFRSAPLGHETGLAVDAIAYLTDKDVEQVCSVERD